MNTIISIIALTIVIMIHELGHYIASKHYGVKVKEFGIGLPFSPKLFTLFHHKETAFTVRALLFGGFISFENDNYAESISPFKRIVISISGPIINVLFGYLGIVSVLVYKGVSILSAFKVPFITVYRVAYETASFIPDIAEKSEQVVGPIGMVSMSNNAIQEGIIYYILFYSLISIAIGIFNLLPFPPLDGWNILKDGYELIVRKRINKKIEFVLTLGGVSFLIYLIVISVFNDISTIIIGW